MPSLKEFFIIQSDRLVEGYPVLRKLDAELGKLNTRTWLTAAMVVLLGVGSAVALSLVQINQDVRQQASGAYPTIIPTGVLKPTSTPQPTATIVPIPTATLTRAPSLTPLPTISRVPTITFAPTTTLLPTITGGVTVTPTQASSLGKKCDFYFTCPTGYSCSSAFFGVCNQSSQPTVTPIGATPTPVIAANPIGQSCHVFNPCPTGYSCSGLWGVCGQSNAPTITPTQAPTPTILNTNGAINGLPCKTNYQCASKSCLPTIYGSYCGAATQQECTPYISKKCELKSGLGQPYSCDSNGFWVKTGQCNGGCAGNVCQTNVCIQGEQSCDGTGGLLKCNSTGTGWNHQSCPSGKECKGKGDCIDSQTAYCSLKSTCSGDQVCSAENNQKKQCVDGKWALVADGTPISFVGECTQREIELYTKGLNMVKDLTKGLNMKISCDVQTRHGCGNIAGGFDGLFEKLSQGGESIIHMTCDPTQDFPADMDWMAKADREKMATTTVGHEAMHLWARDVHGHTAGEIDSFNQAIGCKRTGFTTYEFTKESPTTDYGKKDCAEALAESAVVFYTDPCTLKQKYPLQYSWFETSPDSPAKGSNKCPS